MNTHLVSILLPIYRSSGFVRSADRDLLSQALKSLLSQTYRHFELIILDDQSTGRTVEVCREFSQNDPRIRIVIDDNKRSLEAAITRLATLVQGKYCMLAGDDTVWDSKYLQCLIGVLESDPSLELAYSNGKYMDLDGRDTGHIVNSEDDAHGASRSRLNNVIDFICKGNVIPIASVLFKAESFHRFVAPMLFAKNKTNVDKLWMMKFLIQGGRCKFVNQHLFLYRGMSRKPDPENICGMLPPENSLLIWWCYVRHEAAFFDQINQLVNSVDFSSTQKAYLRCVILDAFLRNTMEQLNWLRNDGYLHSIKDKVIHYMLRKSLRLFFDNTWAITDFGSFESDRQAARFEAPVVRALLEKTLLKVYGFKSILRLYQVLSLTDDRHPIIQDVGAWINREKLKFQSELLATAALMNQVPEIISGSGIAFKPSDNPKVTVFVASYNLGRFVRDTILTILRQDYSSCEVIVGDGASTDDTLSILKEFPQVQVISEKDDGYMDAFWKAVRKSRGAYITQCCISDGYLARNWIRRCVEVMENDPEVSLVWGFPQYLSEDGKLGEISYPQFHHCPPPQKKDFFEYWLKTQFYFPEGNFCVRKEVIEKCMPKYGPELKNLEPFLEFNYQFHRQGYLAYHLPIVANFGRTHANQSGQRETQSGTLQKKGAAYFEKSRAYRRDLLLGLAEHMFRDGQGHTISGSFTAAKFQDFMQVGKITQFKTRVFGKVYRLIVKKLFRTNRYATQ